MNDPNGPLHPNLARIAAEYDQICSDWAAGKITAETANRHIAALAARDDEGVVWSIDPITGGWVWRAIDGTQQPGEPPTWGYATATAHNVTRNPSTANPDRRIVYTQVGDMESPGELTGSTRRPQDPVVFEKDNRTVRIIALILAIALTVTAGGWALTALTRDDRPTSENTSETEQPADRAGS